MENDDYGWPSDFGTKYLLEMNEERHKMTALKICFIV